MASGTVMTHASENNILLPLEAVSSDYVCRAQKPQELSIPASKEKRPAAFLQILVGTHATKSMFYCKFVHPLGRCDISSQIYIFNLLFSRIFNLLLPGIYLHSEDEVCHICWQIYIVYLYSSVEKSVDATTASLSIIYIHSIIIVILFRITDLGLPMQKKGSSSDHRD